MVYNNFLIRLMFSLILITIYFFIVLYNFNLIFFFISLIYFLIFLEIIIFFKIFKIIPITYLFISFIFFLFINFESNQIYKFNIFIIAVIAFDTFSYICGKIFGLRKISKISPNKTIEGLFGGFISSLSISSLYIYYNEIDLDFKSLIFITSIILFSFAGDIIESYFKRKNNLKNSSNFIPGHGGFFDRFDSFIFAIIFYSVTNVYLL
tara:strand:- start:603 stop:1226 length:624 start_codon:yes stop_codon:yes gene_type:complete